MGIERAGRQLGAGMALALFLSGLIGRIYISGTGLARTPGSWKNHPLPLPAEDQFGNDLSCSFEVGEIQWILTEFNRL